MQADKKTTVLVWASVGAAAAGIAVAAILYKCRGKLCGGETQPETDQRHIEQVLQDCYNKIHEIEAKIPDIAGRDLSVAKPARKSVSHSARATNGKPVLES